MYNPYYSNLPYGTSSYQDRLNALQQQVQSQAPAPRYETIRVNGENGAQMLPMGARSEVLALDQSRNDILLAWYIQTDDAGYKTKTPYVLTPYSQNENSSDLETRVKRLEELINAESAATVAKPKRAAKPNATDASTPDK